MVTKVKAYKILQDILSKSDEEVFTTIRGFLEDNYPKQMTRIKTRKRSTTHYRNAYKNEIKVSESEMLRYKNSGSCFGKSFDSFSENCKKCGDFSSCRRLIYGATPILEEEIPIAQEEAKETLYVYNKGDRGKYPILLVAHVDTVRHKDHITVSPKRFKKEGLVFHNKDGILGGDDRAGVAILLLLKEMFPEVPLLFTNFEESGGAGATSFTMSEDFTKDDFRLFVEFDRAGSDHYVVYNHLPKEIEKYIADKSNLKKSEGGSFSDIRTLTNKYLIPSINVATGYFNAHSSNEVVHLDSWWNSLLYGISLIENCREIPVVENYSPQKSSVCSTSKGSPLKLSAKAIKSLRLLRNWDSFTVEELLKFFPNLQDTSQSLETFGLELNSIICKVGGIKDSSTINNLYIKSINSESILQEIFNVTLNNVITEVVKSGCIKEEGE